MSFPFPVRKIIHVDMDAFYASVEQMDHPHLRGKPVAVGGSRERGVVAAASYEARRYGVYSAMASTIAARRCPGLIFVPPRFDRYAEVSQSIREIFFSYTDLVEPLSLDEAFLDVTENKTGHPSATMLAMQIRQRIREEIGLNASAGISINKFLAKVASDINKPNGQKTIPPEEVFDFLEKLPIEKFFGIGKVTAERMHRQGILTGKQLRERSLEYLVANFGKAGQHYYDIVRGIQCSEVQPDRVRKSIAAERTFSEDLESAQFMLDQLDRIADDLERRLQRNETGGKTITLKLKYSDFTQQTRSRTLPVHVRAKADFFPVIRELLLQEPPRLSVRLLGISVSKLEGEEAGKSFFVQTRLDF